MDHLTTERLAALVDDTPESTETQHLDTCDLCADELEALRAQTRALASLPELLPPRGDWEVLRARLRSEGLLQDPGLLARLGSSRTPSWMRVAASILLFVTGVMTGAAWADREGREPGSAMLSEPENLEAAASAVRLAEHDYITAMTQYRALAGQSGVSTDGADPLTRYAALEHLVLVSQAALRQAPGDPYLNGLLTSALAERDAAARLVSSTGGEWF